MPSAPAPPSSVRRLRFAFVALVLGGFLAVVLLPSRVTTALGLATNGVWFVDTYAILASGEAWQAGQDPAQPNPLDLYGRPHSYSSWWFLLNRAGLTRDDNALVGGVVASLLLLGAVWWLRPQTSGQLLTGLLALLSPIVLLAFNRANNDLVLFGLLVIGLGCLRDATPWRVAILGATVVLATGLKFFPIVAAGAMLVLAPPRLRWTALIVTGAAAGLVLWSQWEWFRRAVFPVPEGVYLFGAAAWWRELGLKGWGLGLVTAISLWVGAVWVNRRGGCRGLADAAEPLAPRVGFVVGALMLVGCWLAGISYAYRWIFGLLLLPWLWRREADTSARLTLGLLLLCLWMDGLFCLATNLLIGPMPRPRLRAMQHLWQLGTQPVAWALMVMLSAWGWELVLTRLRESSLAWRWTLAAPRRWLLSGLLLGWLACTVSDQLRLKLGLPNSETWFLDSYAVLAASDAHRDGLDAAAAGHYDPLGRPHSYSDWWYVLGAIGFTRDDNFLVGLSWVLAAVVTIGLAVRPRDGRELLWSLAVLLSPGVFLGLNRANNDLVVFTLLGLGLLALQREHWGWHAVAAALVALATGLKFYPVVAGLALGWHHLRAGRPRTALASAALVGLALLAVWPQMVRGQFPVAATVHVWGARIWPGDLGLGPAETHLFLALGLGLGVVLAWRRAFRSILPDAARRDHETAFALGALLLVACFVAGSNHGYRWIFAVWLGPWLLERARSEGLPRLERRAAGLTWWLLPVVLWLDGVLCLLVNTGGLSVPGMDYTVLQHGWRLLTQPVHWLLMVLLGGALAGLAVSAWTSVRRLNAERTRA